MTSRWPPWLIPPLNFLGQDALFNSELDTNARTKWKKTLCESPIFRKENRYGMERWGLMGTKQALKK